MSPGLRAGRPGLSSVAVLSLKPDLWVSGQTSAPSVFSFRICAMSGVREDRSQCSEVVACASPKASIPQSLCSRQLSVAASCECTLRCLSLQWLEKKSEIQSLV